MNKKAPPGTQSVLRAVRLLKALVASGREMDLAELTRGVGLARTTTHRLLSALESEGLVARTGVSGAYRLGPAAIALGTQAMRSNDLRGVVRPFLEELASRTGETATLEVLSDDRMLILDEALGRHLVGAQPSLGTAWALHATSTGKALLAAMPPRERDALLAGRLESFTPSTITQKRELAGEIEQAGRRGWASSYDELAEGFAAVAAVVRDAMGEPVGAISLNLPTARCPRRRLPEFGELVVAAAAKSSDALAGRSAVAR